MTRELRLKSRFTRWVPGTGEGITRRIREGPYAHALDEDVAMRLLPYARRKGYEIAAVPDTDSARELVRNALRWDEGGEFRDLGDAARHFFRTCAQYLMEFGEVVWEVCPCDPQGVALVFVQPHTLKRRWLKTVQVSCNDEGRKVLTPIPDGRLVRVRPRDSQRFRAARERLAGPAFSHGGLLPLIGQEDGPPVDVREMTRNENLALAQVGLICDWDGRTFFARRVSEFYLLLRVLRFRRRISVLRGEILAGINAAFERTKVPARLSVVGLQTAAELSQIERDFLSGVRSLKEIREALLGPAAE